MARRKRMSRRPSASHNTTVAADGKQPGPEKNWGSSTDQELERQIAAVKAIADMEVENLRTALRLIRSNFTEEELKTPVLQYFKENLPKVSVVRDSDGHFDLRWKVEDGNPSVYDTSQKDIHAARLLRMSMGFPSCSTARESFGGYPFSANFAKDSLVGGDDFQIWNYMSQGSLNTFQTPGASSQRLSIGMTPKTQREPKPGEMLLSVHGSPLGFHKENNMEAIHESEEA